jgi:hypothetical protein
MPKYCGFHFYELAINKSYNNCKSYQTIDKELEFKVNPEFRESAHSEKNSLWIHGKQIQSNFCSQVIKIESTKRKISELIPKINPKVISMNKRICNNSENLSNETKTTFDKKWLPKVNVLSDDYLLSFKAWRRTCGDSQPIDDISRNTIRSKSHQNIEIFPQKTNNKSLNECQKQYFISKRSEAQKPVDKNQKVLK